LVGKAADSNRELGAGDLEDVDPGEQPQDLGQISGGDRFDPIGGHDRDGHRRRIHRFEPLGRAKNDFF
jgi:hypothetical protein